MKICSINKCLIFILLTYTLFLIVSGVSAPIFAYFKIYNAADFLYALMHKSCNQDAIRTFWLLGYPMALCARCLGSYVGFFVMLSLFLKNKCFPMRFIVLIGLLAFLEIIFEHLGLFYSNNNLRFLDGVLLGCFIANMLNGIGFMFKKGF